MGSSVNRFREIGILGVVIALVIVFQTINPMFMTPANIFVMLRSSAFVGIVAVGMGFLLISGMIDISVGSIAGLASVASAYAVVKMGLGIEVGILIGLLIGLSCGLINAFLILRMHLPAFLATIGTMYAYRGIAQTISKGYTIFPLPESVGNFGSAAPLGISWAWWLFIALVIVGDIVLAYTVWGLKVKAIGSDREIARMTEVDVNRVSAHVFALCGICAAVAGMLLTSRVASGTPTMGEGWELGAITAAAIGGVSLFGFEGSMMGVLLGVLLIQVVQNGLVVIGASAYLQSVEIGVLLILTAIVDVKRKEQLERRKDSSR
jgi:ribose transport system permease protein